MNQNPMSTMDFATTTTAIVNRTNDATAMTKFEIITELGRRVRPLRFRQILDWPKDQLEILLNSYKESEKPKEPISDISGNNQTGSFTTGREGQIA